ncbi:MAG: cytochrome c, partial [Verrucomicrobiota bacterium]
MRAFFTLLLLSTLVSAEPLVVGFERFHEEEPTIEGGRLLFNELGCANCHDHNTQLPPRKGPDLNAVFTRISADWTREFLQNPQQARPGATMPNPGLTEEEASLVVHYLASLTPKSYKTPRGSRHVNAERGSELFHRYGCASCHSPSPDFHPADGKPEPEAFTYLHIAFPDLSAKYDLMSLSAFLLDPLKSRPHGRMPKLEMEPTDSIDIAAHLLDFQDSNGLNAPRLTRLKPEPDKVSQGRAIVESKRCAACHDLPKASQPEFVNLTGDQGCLSGNNPDLPQYDLSPSQQAALATFLGASEQQDKTIHKRVDRRLEALNCYACHDRDGKGGPDDARMAYLTGDPSIGDTGRYPPPLTGTGRKLQTDWLKGVFKGQNRVRDYVHSRMPIYGDLTNGLADELAALDQQSSEPFPPAKMDAGRKLVGTQGGLNCIICHQWGDRPSLGIQALDISNLAERLQPGWLEEYLLNPAAYRP